MHRMLKPLSFLFVAALAGCVHPSNTRVAGVAAIAPHPADSAVDAAVVARSIRLCRTQLADLQQQLGQPTRDGTMHKQRIVDWTVRWDAPRRELAVLVNAQDIVVDVDWDVSPDIPWSPTDQCMAP